MDLYNVKSFKEKLEYLKNLITSNKLPHLFLFYGEKNNFSLALIIEFLKILNCENKKKPCNECVQCKNINKFSHPDIKLVFPEIISSDKNSDKNNHLENFKNLFFSNHFISIDEWRHEINSEKKQLIIPQNKADEIINFIKTQPVLSKYNVTIIWLAEFLNIGAANSLLKILEEPYSNNIFFLITNDLNKILSTIQSRSIKIHIGTLNEKEFNNTCILQNKDIENEYCDQFITWIRSCFSLSFNNLIQFIDNLSKKDKEKLKEFINYCTKYLVYILNIIFGIEDNNNLTENNKITFIKMSKIFDDKKINQLQKIFSECNYKISRNANIKILFFNISVDINKVLNS